MVIDRTCAFAADGADAHKIAVTIICLYDHVLVVVLVLALVGGGLLRLLVEAGAVLSSGICAYLCRRQSSRYVVLMSFFLSSILRCCLSRRLFLLSLSLLHDPSGWRRPIRHCLAHSQPSDVLGIAKSAVGMRACQSHLRQAPSKKQQRKTLFLGSFIFKNHYRGDSSKSQVEISRRLRFQP